MKPRALGRPLNDNLDVRLATLACRSCRAPIAERPDSIYAVVGTDVRAWCSPVCAANAGVWPWVGADAVRRATWR